MPASNLVHVLVFCFQVQAFTNFPGEVSPVVSLDIVKTPGEMFTGEMSTSETKYDLQ